MLINTKLLKLETGEAIYERGEKYYEENQTNKISFTLLGPKLHIKANIKEYETIIQTSIEDEKIIQSECSCIYNKKHSSPCKHIVSLSLQTNHKAKTCLPSNYPIISENEKKQILKENISELNSTKTKELTKNLPKSVTEINEIVKKLLEENTLLTNITVEGEISNFSPNKSGHYYFTIKDSKSCLSCVLFKFSAINLTFKPQTGDKIIVKGNIKVYEPRGTYQLVVSEIKKEGEGELYAKFIAIKEKLKKIGIFNIEDKKPIPKYPKTIGVVTSPTGSVIQDIINTVKRRFPKIKLVISPARVQGEGSEETIIKALNILENKIKPDTIIIARGGGSIEDLWCFNEEKLALEIHKCKIPIISAVGHETDFTICDFASDLRAPTPTAAAEISTPSYEDLMEYLTNKIKTLNKSLKQNLEHKKENIARLESEIEYKFSKIIEKNKNLINNFEEKLSILSAKKTLERGYSITIANNKTIHSNKDIKKGDKLTTILKDSKITSTVN